LDKVTIEIISLDLFSTLVFVDRRTFNSREVLKNAIMNSSAFKYDLVSELSVDRLVDLYHSFLKEEMFNYEKEEEFNNEELLKKAFSEMDSNFNDNLIRVVKEIILNYFNELMFYLHPFPKLHETLDYLKSKNYRLIMVSNHSYPQHGWTVLTRYNMVDYFDKIVFSGDIGFKKPSKKIFSYALTDFSYSSKEKIVHIGDDFKADVEGALNFGIEAIWIKNDHSIERVAGSSLKFQVISEIKDLMELF